jgi:zinc protease
MAGFLCNRLRGAARIRRNYAHRSRPPSPFSDAEYSLSIYWLFAGNGGEPRGSFSQIELLKKAGPEKDDLAKVKEIQRRDYETDVKQNGYWLEALWSAAFTGQSPEQILGIPQRIERLSVEDVRKTAGDVLRLDNYVRVVLLPEKSSAP